MKHVTRTAFIMLVAIAFTAPALIAAEETLSGTLVCAKCALKKADAAECQDVLLVKNAKGETVEYYVEKNKVAEESGDACTVEIKAKVTGTVSEKDGRKWIAPSKIEKEKS
jgi:Family of unknown function (DUF6370)